MHAGRTKLSRHLLFAAMRLEQERFHYEAWQVREIAKRLDPTGGVHLGTAVTENRQTAPQISPHGR